MTGGGLGGALSAFFFFPNVETGEPRPRLKRTKNARSLWPLRVRIVNIVVTSRCELSLVQILVACRTECHVVRLILYQQVRLSRRVGLVAGQAIHRSVHV